MPKYPRTFDESFLERCSPDCAAVYHYWKRKRGDRPMPSRKDIDPLELARYLPRILLVNVDHDPLRLTYRLVGTTEVAARGSDPTGKSLPEHCFGESKEEAYNGYLEAIERRSFVFDEQPKETTNPRLFGLGTLLMPLSSDGERVDMVLVFSDYQPF